MYRVEYFCPRQSQEWQPLRGFLWSQKTFLDLDSAIAACDSLVWQYHSARVIDPWGNVVYQI